MQATELDQARRSLHTTSPGAHRSGRDDFRSLDLDLDTLR
jgi:hypothetical protein